MCFTNFVGSAQTREECGKALIGVVCLYTLVHVSILVVDLIVKLRGYIRRAYYKRRNNRLLKEYA